MPVELHQIRHVLLPGLRELILDVDVRILGIDQTARWYPGFTPSAPHIWIPKVGIIGAVGLGAAAAVVKNPEVTRRFWQGWKL